MYSYLWRYLYFSIWSNNVFYVYVLECFVLVEVYKLVVKAVWKLAYRQILVAFCARSKASKALKGFCLFFSNFIATVIKNLYKTKKVVSRQPNLLLNLKSNTMKNTVQKYCFLTNWPNILSKKCYFSSFCQLQFAKCNH